MVANKICIQALKTGPRASFLFVLVILFVTGCDETSQNSTKLSGSTMGTSYHITLASPVSDVAALQQQMDQLLSAINLSMSTYIPDSEISRFNHSPIGEPFPVSKDFCSVMTVAQQIFEQSRGAFDPTVGELVALWGFGADLVRETLPDASQIKAALDKVGFEHIEVDCDSLKLIRNADVTVDLSAIAKGYGVDRVAEFLLEQGFNDFLVEIGGELRLSGQNAQHQPWRIAIEQPSSLQRDIQQIVTLTNTGMATSGDYRNFFEYQGKHYSHTIDPATGNPVTHMLASVTVIHASATIADALATAFMVLGVESSLQWAESKDIPAYFQVKTSNGVDNVFEIRESSAFSQLLGTKESLR